MAAATSPAAVAAAAGSARWTSDARCDTGLRHPARSVAPFRRPCCKRSGRRSSRVKPCTAARSASRSKAALPMSYLRRDAPARERALMMFAKLRVWDTERNNGVLIYVDLADHQIEIVADRGLAPHVTAEEWNSDCRGRCVMLSARGRSRPARSRPCRPSAPCCRGTFRWPRASATRTNCPTIRPSFRSTAWRSQRPGGTRHGAEGAALAMSLIEPEGLWDRVRRHCERDGRASASRADSAGRRRWVSR